MSESTEEAHRRIVMNVLRSVRDDDIGHANLATLAASASLSSFYFHRTFKRWTCRTPKEHVHSFEMIRAAIELRTSRRPIVQIAMDAGYRNHESFSRAFREQFNVSPRTYRKQHLIHKDIAMKDLNPSIALIKVPVTDFGRASTFYREVLGLEEQFAVEAYGWGQYKVGNLSLCIYVVGMGGGDGQPGGETQFHLGVDDASKAYSLLKERGASLPLELTSSDDGGQFFMVADPDGNKFKVVQRT